MLTLREAVIEQPFRDRRYRQHRRKVVSARPRIDATPPRSYPHLSLKLRQLRLESDRQDRICEDNIRLAHRMAVIMRSKRLDNYNYGPVGPYSNTSSWLAKSKLTFTSNKLPKRRSESDSSSLDSSWPSGPESLVLLRKVTEEAERRETEAAKRLHPRLPAVRAKRVQHRAPTGWCLVPWVGSGQRSPTPPAPLRKQVSKRVAARTITPPPTTVPQHEQIDSAERVSRKRYLRPLSLPRAESSRDSTDDNTGEKEDDRCEGQQQDKDDDNYLTNEDKESDEQVAQVLINNFEELLRKLPFKKEFSVCETEVFCNEIPNKTEKIEFDDCKLKNLENIIILDTNGKNSLAKIAKQSLDEIQSTTGETKCETGSEHTEEKVTEGGPLKSDATGSDVDASTSSQPDLKKQDSDDLACAALLNLRTKAEHESESDHSNFYD